MSVVESVLKRICGTKLCCTLLRRHGNLPHLRQRLSHQLHFTVGLKAIPLDTCQGIKEILTKALGDHCGWAGMRWRQLLMKITFWLWWVVLAVGQTCRDFTPAALPEATDRGKQSRLLSAWPVQHASHSLLFFSQQPGQASLLLS